MTEFDLNRQSEFKSWWFELFLLLEIEAWQTENYIKGYVSLTITASLFRPTLSFNESAFTFTNEYLRTPGRALPTITFYKDLPSILPLTHLHNSSPSTTSHPMHFISFLHYHSSTTSMLNHHYDPSIRCMDILFC